MKRKVLLSVDDAVLAEIDECAARAGLDRSTYIVTMTLARHRPTKDIRVLAAIRGLREELDRFDATLADDDPSETVVVDTEKS